MDIKRIVESLAIELVENELCPRGKKYLAARKAAGEKSSAYLSGRAVKVCKGQIKFGGAKKKTWKEDIDPSEAYSNLNSIKTLVDGKRKVAMIALKDQSDAADTIKLINDNGFGKIGIDQRPGDEVYVVYVPGAEADAKELVDILNRYGGYASYKASYEDTKRIGELLGYKKETIDAYLEKNYDENHQLKESLRNWFDKEKWVRIDTQGNIAGDCGTMPKGKPTQRCLPKAKAQSLSKAERASTTRKKIAGSKKGKQFVPNTKKAKVSLEELDLKKAAAVGAMALGTLGAPKASGQNFIQKIKDKIHPQTQQVDTVKVQKDTPLQLAKFKDYKGAGYGYAKSPSESTAYKIAKQNATKDLIQKIGQQKITAGIEEKAVKRYQNPDGSYEVEVLLVIGNL